MDAKDIARQRSLISKRVKALKELYASDGLTTEDFQREMIAVQERKRKLRAAEKKLAQQATPNLPAVIDTRQGSKRGREKRSFPPKEGRDEFGNSTNKETVAQYDSLLADKPERRCNGTNAQGEQCRNFAIKGGRVCKFHGGATRHVKEAARVRVEMASDRLMGKLIEIAYDDQRPASVQLDAIKDSLNRAGLTKPAQVEVGPIKPFEEVFEGIFSGPRTERGIVEQQPNSDTPASVASAHPGHSEPIPTWRDSDSDPLAAPQSREHRRARPSPYQGGAMTGEDAIARANEENARQNFYAMPSRRQRALPPGRSDR